MEGFTFMASSYTAGAHTDRPSGYHVAMAHWTRQEPCSNCGGPHGKKLQCGQCRIVGCQLCLGGTAKGICKVCKKVAERRPL